MEAVAVDHLPVAKREDLHRGAVALDREPDHIDGSHGVPVRCLPLGEMPDREETVAVPRRLLEALVSRRFLHARPELPLDRQRVPGEEPHHALDDLAVILGGDLVHTRGEAAVDVEVETGNSGMTPGPRPFARSKLEDAVQDVQRLAYLLRIRERPEVHGSPTGAVPA